MSPYMKYLPLKTGYINKPDSLHELGPKQFPKLVSYEGRAIFQQYWLYDNKDDNNLTTLN